MTDDADAVLGLDAGYVPCPDMAAAEPGTGDAGDAIVGYDAGYVAVGDAAASEPVPSDSGYAVAGYSAAYVANPCSSGCGCLTSFDTFKRTDSGTLGDVSSDGRPWTTDDFTFTGTIDYYAYSPHGVDPHDAFYPTDTDPDGPAPGGGLGPPYPYGPANGDPVTESLGASYGCTAAGGFISNPYVAHRVALADWPDINSFVLGAYALHLQNQSSFAAHVAPTGGDPWTTGGLFQFCVVFSVTYTADTVQFEVLPVTPQAQPPVRQHVEFDGDHLTGAGLPFGPDGQQFSIRLQGTACDVQWIVTVDNTSGSGIIAETQFPSVGNYFAYIDKTDWASGQEYVLEGYADELIGVGIRVYPNGGTPPAWTEDRSANGAIGMDSSCNLEVRADYTPMATDLQWHDLNFC